MSIKDMLLKIAGRDSTGKARALKVSEDGVLHTQLTGSKVEPYVLLQDVNATAGSLVWAGTGIHLDSFEKFTIGVECAVAHYYEVIVRFHGSSNAILLDEIVIDATGGSTIRRLTDALPVRAERISIRVRNKSDIDQNYKHIQLYGVK